MNKYYAISFGTPPALVNFNNTPEGVIVGIIHGDKTPSRSAIQKRFENKGFRGYVKMVKSERFEKNYTIEGAYFYKN